MDLQVVLLDHHTVPRDHRTVPRDHHMVLQERRMVHLRVHTDLLLRLKTLRDLDQAMAAPLRAIRYQLF